MVLDGKNDVRRAVSGDEDALARLLERYGPGVRRSIRGEIPAEFRSVLSEDDVMQESYAEAFLAIGGFDPDGCFLAWLERIAKNNLLDAVKGLRAERRGGNRRRVAVGRDGDEVLSLWDILDSGGTTPARGAMREELGELVRRAVAELPKAYAEVVRLYDLECRNAEEVAERLECSPGAVYMRRARAHDMLRQMLGSFTNYA